MSYSFSVVGANKADVMKKIEDQLDAISRSQPAHIQDCGVAKATALAYLNLLKPVSDGHELHVSMHGSVGWNHDAPDALISAGVGVSASIRKSS